MELYQLKSFALTAETGNLTRAAERLFTSQPAVSAHIKALEEELGVQLFDRTARGMSLTRHGEALLAKTDELLANAKGLADLARSLQSSPSGPFRIGVMLDAPDLKLEIISSALQARYSGLELEFAHSSSGVIAKGLLDGDLDIGFVEGVVESPLLQGARVGQTQAVVVGSPRHKRTFESSNWADLAALPWVFKTPECSFHQLMTRIAKAHDLQLNRQYVIDHDATCLQFVRNGSAVSVVNRVTAQQDLDSGTLIAWPAFDETLDIHLVSLAKRSQEPAIRAFFEAANAALAFPAPSNA